MTSSDTDYEIALEDQKLRIIEWEHLNLYKFYPLALASSFSVRCALYPLAVVKSRLALQKQNNVYRGMTHAFSTIVRTEGITALYRGYWVTIPQLSASFVYSTVYEGLRNVFRRSFDITSPALVSALAGGAASTTTQLIFVPTDIVAQYMMVYNKPQSFVGSSKSVAVIDCLRSDGLEKRFTLGLRVIRAVYKVDGLAGFYRGFLSSLMLYIPSSMVFWSTYYNALSLLSHLYKTISSRPSDEGNLLKIQAMSGGIGGIMSAICTNPLEVLRIRIQVHRTGYVETFRRLMAFEGVRVFTKGYESVKRVALKDELHGSAYLFMAATGRFARVQQWLQFHRQWHVVDAAHQDAYKLGQKVADHLSGKYKPIWHPESDCGDYVVVYNCKDVAMKGFDWKHTLYHFNKEYPQSKNDIPAYQIHEYDPCRIMFMATYSGLGNNLLRRQHILRLHLFSDDDISEPIRANIGKQLESVQFLPKKSTDYSDEDRAHFPRLMNRGENHILDWENPVQQLQYIRDPRIKKKK